MRISMLFLPIFILINSTSYAQKDEIIHPEWRVAGILPATNGKHLGFAGPIAGVSNEVFITGGGANFPDAMPWLGGKKRYYNEVFLYRKTADDSLIRFGSATLPFAIAYPACATTELGIVVAGGENESGTIRDVHLLNWDAFQKKIVIKPLPDLPVAVASASMAVWDGVLYLAGGDAADETSAQFISLDLRQPQASWKRLSSLPHPASHTVLVAQANGANGSIYLIGGRKKTEGRLSELFKTVFRFDIKIGSWTEVRSMAASLSAATGVAVGEHSILVFGGDRGETFHRTEELILAIAATKDTTTRDQLISEKIKVQSAHPGFTKDILQYNTITDEWTKAGEIPFDSPVTTQAVKWGSEVFIPGGEIRAGVRTAQIISAKLIF